MKKEDIKKIKEYPTHLVIHGGVKAGKTENVVFPLVKELIDSEESFLVVDTNQEYLKAFYKEVKEKGYKTIIINLVDLEHSDGYNILRYPKHLFDLGYQGKAADYLKDIYDEICVDSLSTADPFWETSARDLMIGITLGLFEDAKEEEINLQSVWNMLCSASTVYKGSTILTKYFEKKDSKSMAYLNAAGSVFAPRDTRLSIVSVAQSKIKGIVSNDYLVDTLNRETFKMSDLADEKIAVFIETSEYNGYKNTICNTVLSQFADYLCDMGIPKNFNFILDNYDIYNYRLLNRMKEAIKKNIRYIIVTRDINSVVAINGEYIKSISHVLDVTNTKVIDTYYSDVVEFDNEKSEGITISEVELPTALKGVKREVFDINAFVKAQDNTSDNLDIDSLFKDINEKIELLKDMDKEN